MNKQLRTVFFSLIGIIVILAFLASFFYAKSRKKDVIASEIPEKEVQALATENPSAFPKINSQVTKLALPSERPSSPRETYEIGRGDSLMAIAAKFNLSADELAAANGISDTDKIQIGKLLIVPANRQVLFEIDAAKAGEIQKNADIGRQPWRKDPLEVARSDNAGAYGLNVNSNLELLEKDLNGGRATVVGSLESIKVIIKLIQPVNKGDNGIWAIEQIGPKT